MAGEDIEVAAKFVEIHFPVNYSLGAVDEKRNAVLSANCGNPGNGIVQSENVGNLGNRNHPGAVVDQRFELFYFKPSVRVHRKDPDLRLLSFAVELPRDQIGMMLLLGNYDIVPLPQRILGEAVCDKVQSVGST